MAGLTAAPVSEPPIAREARVLPQLAAIAALRWQIFRNSLRTLPGRLELISRILVGLMMGGGGLLAGFGLGAASFFFVQSGKTEWLALLLWSVFLFWQLFPVMASAFTAPFDSSNLLRFPIPFSSFFLLTLAYGVADPATIAGSFWLVCMAAGIGLADPALLPWALLSLLLFALVNLLLGRVIYAWLERWLAQRRTREILGVVFFLVILSFQLIGPLAEHFKQRAGSRVAHLVSLLPLERILPPGLAGEALARGANGDAHGVAIFMLLLLAYGLLFIWLLTMRLRAQYSGENLGETVAPATARAGQSAVRLGWRLQGLRAPVAAVFEKEIRYLTRSGPILFSIIMPLFILVIFRFSPSRDPDSSQFHAHLADFAFPVGAAYALLMLTNLVYNSFGVEGGGIQFYFMSPVSFREIFLGKNLAHSAVLAFEMVLVWFGATLLYRPPVAGVVVVTLAGILFALLVNLAAGNLLSLYFPKKFDFGTFGRQRASATTVFSSMGIQLIVITLGGLAVFLGYFLHRRWLADTILLVLALIAFIAYRMVLDRVPRIALDKRETLTAELTRA
jgi:ABC-2 type transport system permease protein